MTVDSAEVRAVLESYHDRDLTDGLPVVPISGDYVDEFLAYTTRDPEATLFEVPHLNRRCTTRLAAANAAMAGCRPDYFPVVVAAWEAIAGEHYPVRGIWQSTTGTAPFLIVNGPVRREIELNCEGNIFGSGTRANATIGRAIRLALINVFGLRPHHLDQATQGTPAKYAACIGEYEELSPWEPLHVEHGYAPDDSTVTAAVIRSITHLEARHTRHPEHLGVDLANTLSRTGALIYEHTKAVVILGPEHAAAFGDAGWSKDDTRQFIFEHATVSRATLAAAGKDAVSHVSQWRLPSDHPDASPDHAPRDVIPTLAKPKDLQIVVAGADNAGVSAIAEIFGDQEEIPVTLAAVHPSS